MPDRINSAERFNDFGRDPRDLLVKHFGQETADPGGQHEYRYLVRANGHGGGNVPLQVDLEVSPHWVPSVPPETPRDSGDGEGDTVAVDPDPAGI